MLLLFCPIDWKTPQHSYFWSTFIQSMNTMTSVPKIAIMQPYVFPYLGYFQLLQAVDTFVFYDDVNFIKRGWINRNRILINGKDKLITFPCQGASQNKLINEVGVDTSDKAFRKLLKSFSMAYANAPYYPTVYPLIEQVLSAKYDSIAELAAASVATIAEHLGLDKVFQYSAQTYPNSQGLPKADRLIHIAKQAGYSHYVNAIGGQAIYEKAYFRSKGVSLYFLAPQLPPYPQFDNEFVPGLSIIDVLMFNSTAQALKMLNAYQLI